MCFRIPCLRQTTSPNELNVTCKSCSKSAGISRYSCHVHGNHMTIKRLAWGNHRLITCHWVMVWCSLLSYHSIFPGNIHINTEKKRVLVYHSIAETATYCPLIKRSGLHEKTGLRQRTRLWNNDPYITGLRLRLGQATYLKTRTAVVER